MDSVMSLKRAAGFIAWGVASFLMMSYAQAGPAVKDVRKLRNAVEVSDQELAKMRGRYVSPGQLVYFGVKLDGGWEMANGNIITCGVEMSLDLSGNDASKFKPVFKVYNLSVTASAQPATASAAVTATQQQASVNIDAGGLNNPTGIVQSIQGAGNGNTVANDIQMDIGQGANGATMTSSSQEGAVVVEPGVITMHNGSGGFTTVTVSGDSLGYTIDVPGQGSITQRITTGKGLLQSVQVSGDMNQIRNRMEVLAGTAPAVNRGVSVNIKPALNGLKELSRMGMF